ncbi:MAG: hypothetical protein ACOYJQ_02960 [Pseudochelatococcus sp.]|jgi:hypothetical protein|uniref:hypothetical protein n=1 Tax=Pseudochelatococcus sp. TaxID=2020869 RepID=UPI003D8AB191
MSIEPIGLVTIAIALLCLFLDYRTALILLVIATVFGAASAMFIGPANVPPGHVFLGITAVTVFTRRRETAAFLQALHPDRPGFWLVCTAVYGVATAMFYPRVMAGLTQIVPLGASAFDNTGSTVPLGPVSSNFTQSVYMAASVLGFGVFAALSSTAEGFKAAVAAMLAYAMANTFFAFVDLVTDATGTAAVLDFMRNARYALHTESDVGGMKRIVGAFTEASSFARSSLGVLGVTGTLWLCGYKPLLTGSLALVTLLLTLLSTSSTGLAGLPVMMCVLYVTAVTRCGISPRTRNSSAVVLSLPLLAIFTVLAILLDPKTSAIVGDYIDLVVLSKATTSSGVERGSWNTIAITNFIDSGGIGVGLGTIRTSSIATALLAGVGVIGTLFYMIFLITALLINPGPTGSFATDARTAARNGCFGLMIGDLMVGSTVDQGLFFYALAAIASARPERAPDEMRAGTPTTGRHAGVMA